MTEYGLDRFIIQIRTLELNAHIVLKVRANQQLRSVFHVKETLTTQMSFLAL